MPYPVRLSAGKVVLREFAPSDVDDVLAIIGDDRVTASLSFDSRSRDEAVAMVDGAVSRAKQEPRTEYYLAVAPQGDESRVVGFARIAFAGVQAGKLGYAIAAEHWGRGYATAVSRALVSFGFAQLGLHRISAAIGPENTASVALVEKLGFVREGVLRDHVHTNGAWRDSILYSVLVDEWRP
ncbi:GNAT family N-acetyltransferase [Streptomyces sp. NPDC001502]|uniref:GNAT family N-acetyltransferase n=1 Tax=Streptomyces sp. NPDC001502 TaxID=3364578 RepID=UPI0036BEBC85